MNDGRDPIARLLTVMIIAVALFAIACASAALAITRVWLAPDEDPRAPGPPPARIHPRGDANVP